jgi:hypothetical protein
MAHGQDGPLVPTILDMAELVAFVALITGTVGYAVVVHQRAQRRPTERRLRELEPLIAPWLVRSRATSH